MSATVLHGDCLAILPTLQEASADSVVTDPPYHFASIVRRFGAPDSAPALSNGATGVYARASRGFMGKTWDGGDIAFRPETWAAVLRVLKPGGHLVAFGAPKNYHRLACAIEDAGFEVRDSLMWLFGTGFPKSHDVAKGIDKALGREGTYGEKKPNFHSQGDCIRHEGWRRPWMDDPEAVDRYGREYHPSSEEAVRWQGWGTALKPAYEPIILARKPLIGTVAENVLAHGTGALNIDGTRISIGDEAITPNVRDTSSAHEGWVRPWMDDKAKDAARQEKAYAAMQEKGRWPANIVHDGSDEVLAGFPESRGQLADVSPDAPSSKTSNVYGKMNREGEASANRRYADKGSTNFAPLPGQRRGDSGSAARFFYCAKATKAERAGSKHPTVKPLALMRWLVRLVTPPGGLVLDPFAGTGTTGQAAIEEGFRAILIEREAEYQADIERRLSTRPAYQPDLMDASVA